MTTKKEACQDELSNNTKVENESDILGAIDCVITNLGDNDRFVSSMKGEGGGKRKRMPPIGLESQYRELYRVLERGLMPTNNEKRNVCALLMGPRGHGKTLVLEQCLSELQCRSKFRIVRLNGLLLRGHDVTVVVKEILRQLTEMASSQGNTGTSSVRSKKEAVALRSRQSSFLSSLLLLEEVLRLAKVDQIPILIILQDMDSFLSNKKKEKKQLLLYHLLDRVADHGSYLSLVGMTPRLSTVGMLEKRVKSRAEGTSTILYFGHPPYFDTLSNILLSKFQINDASQEFDHQHEAKLVENGLCKLQNDLQQILTYDKKKKHTTTISIHHDHDECEKVQGLFKRAYAQGKDVRWFSRVLTVSLSLLAQDEKTTLSPKYLWEGLMSVNGGVSFDPKIFQKSRIRMASSNNSESRTTDGSKSVNSTFQSDYAPLDRNGKPMKLDGLLGCDGRILALLDCPGPQIALLLAARRILLRQEEQEKEELPLTYERMVMEYQSSFVQKNKSMGPDRYDIRILYPSFLHLVHVDLLKPATDHTGGAMYQYYHTNNTKNLQRCPMHLNIQMHDELGILLKDNMLDCTTSLRDWGLTIH